MYCVTSPFSIRSQLYFYSNVAVFCTKLAFLTRINLIIEVNGTHQQVFRVNNELARANRDNSDFSATL